MLDDYVKLRGLDETLCGSGIIAFALVTRNFEKTMMRFGTSFGEFAILWYLSNMKEEINLSQVKQNTFLYSGANITKVTEKLVQKGFINRRENPVSRREKLVKITPAGNKFVSRVMSKIRKMYGSILKSLTVNSKEKCLKDLNIILGNMIEMAGME